MSTSMHRDRLLAHDYCAHEPVRLLNPANLVTAGRTAGSLVVFGYAITSSSTKLLIVALLIYWVGDIVDGKVARALHCETREGAIFDILCDRLGCSTFYIAWALQHHDAILPVCVFLAQFMVVDNQLSLAFLRWPLRSPNYFYVVDQLVWRLNWSTPAKATNSGLLAVLLVVVDAPMVALITTSTILCVKVISLVRVHALPRVEGSTCLNTVSRGSWREPSPTPSAAL